MPRPDQMTPPVVDRRRPGLVWPVRADPAGITGPTRAQARGRSWTSPFKGLFLPVGLDPVLAVDQAIVSAAALLPAGGAVTGWAALRWQGVRFLDGFRGGDALPIPLAVPAGGMDARSGILVARDEHLRADLREVDGLTVSGPVAAVAFEVQRARGLRAAVAMIDRAAAADLVSLAELRAHAADLIGARWITRYREAIELADENCWSPTETVMRLQWRSIGLADVVCNRPVFDVDGSFVGTPDLLHLPTGVAGEYDGAVHLAGAQRAVDIRREGALRRAGLEYVEMVAADLRNPTDFLQRTRDAVARAAGLPRRWTIEPPSWWVPTHTVEMRRSLSEWERARFLRWQAV